MKFEGYCVKCKRRRSCIDAKNITTSNHKRALEGHCFHCLTKVIVFV